MKKWTIGKGILCAVLVFGLGACGQKPAETAPAAVEPAATPVAQEIPVVEPPADYQARINPLVGNPQAVAAGAALFKTNCASCHGELGKGDGVASAALTPRPQDLSNPERAAKRTDAYVFWRVSEGGSMPPFNSAMTPWKETLSEEERWQVVEFVKSLAPAPVPAPVPAADATGETGTPAAPTAEAMKAEPAPAEPAKK